MADFLQTWAALIIGLVALVQPWVRAAWGKFIWKPTLSPHPTGTIEAGFSGLGPTVGLIGSLECRHRQVFVRSMELLLIRLKDGSSHRFSWGIFRPLTFGAATQTFELSSGFVVRPEEPYRYNIQFWENLFQKELRPKLDSLREAWQSKVLEQLGPALQAAASGAENAPAPSELRRGVEELYREFSQSQLHISTYDSLQRMCYWDAGDYRVDLKISTSNPSAVHTTSWQMTLSEDAVQSLRINIVKILQEVCAQPFGQFNFVYLPYGVVQAEVNA